jgi:hypothetical protein
MKLKIFTTATVLGLLSLTVAHAQVTAGLHGNIPFGFQVGQTAFPAGEYAVSRDMKSREILQLRSLDRKTIAILFSAAPALTSKSVKNTELVFNRYGTTYFLRQVWQGFGQNGNALPLSKAERVTASQMAALPIPHNVELASVSFHPRVK